jgi:isopenicillin-N N-acyltransferase-like protein
VNVPPTSTPTIARIAQEYAAAVTLHRHVSTEASPGDRGRALGLAQRDRIGLVTDVYARLHALNGLGLAEVARFGRQAVDKIAVYSPELGTEIEGIAAGSGLPVETIGALNARTELLAASAGECSTIACLGSMTASGSAFGVQTWDWHNELADGWIVWTIEHPDGRRVETLTEAGIVGKIGINDRGVAVLLNILGHRDDGPPVGVPIHVLCRSVLDQADGAVTALELVAAADVSASSAITVVTDEDGGTVCTVEVSRAGPGFVTPDDRGVLVHTNHFLEDPGRDGDSALRESPGTILRLNLARRRMGAMRPGEATPTTVLAAMSSHRGGPSAMCCHHEPGAALGDRWTTLATVVAEPALRELVVYRGGPCQIEAASTTAAAARQ